MKTKDKGFRGGYFLIQKSPMSTASSAKKSGQVFSNLRISRSLVKNQSSMNVSGKTVSQEAMEAEWLEIQAAQQNPAAFRPLYNRYYEPIFRFIMKRTQDEAVCGDVCSLVFVKAIQKLHKYQFKGVPFSAWLFRIASNEVAQHYRQVQKNRVVSIEDSAIPDMVEEFEEDDISKYREVLIEVLEELKESDLEIIELRFFEQRPFKEISEILDITESNAKVRTYRVLERLKKKLLAR